jgi:hypothetical protein
MRQPFKEFAGPFKFLAFQRVVVAIANAVQII